MKAAMSVIVGIAEHLLRRMTYGDSPRRSRMLVNVVS